MLLLMPSSCALAVPWYWRTTFSMLSIPWLTRAPSALRLSCWEAATCTSTVQGTRHVESRARVQALLGRGTRLVS